MNIKLLKQEKGVCLYLDGYLDANTAVDAQEVFLKALNENQRLTLDLSDLNYISSAGLRVLLIVLKRANTIGGELIIANATPEIIEVFEMTGLSRVLKCDRNS